MDTTILADETPLSSDGQPNQFSAPRLRSLQSFLKRQIGGSKSYSKSSIVAALALVLCSVSTNLATSRSLADGIDSYVVPDPKSQTTMLASVDSYTPLVSETNDAEGIVTANILPKEFVLQKPVASQVVTRADQTAAVALANPEPRPTSYAVKQGDTFSTIADRFDLKQSSLRVANLKAVSNIDDLKPGDTLSIPKEDFSASYISKQLAQAESAAKAKTAASTKVALASSKRVVVVRDQADSGALNFGRPAGALGQNGYHPWAIDAPPSGGLAIYASEDGTVEETATGWNGGYGNMVKIAHGGGWETLYAHMASIGVEPGERVSRGQVIGVMGATGHTIPKGAVHVHFEIRHNGQRLNPMNFLR